MLLRLLAAVASGVVLSLAFEPVAAPIVIPFALAGFVLSCRGLRARSGWIPGLAFGIAFQLVLLGWMRAVGTDAWLALASAEAVFLAVLESSVTPAVRLGAWTGWFLIALSAVGLVFAVVWPDLPYGRRRNRQQAEDDGPTGSDVPVAATSGHGASEGANG